MINIRLVINKELIREYNFPGDTQFITIGRRPTHDIPLDNLGVSGDHAKLTFEGDHVVIEDMKSSNGTLLNGMQITRPTAMNPGDTIQIRKFILQVHDKRCGIAHANANEPATILNIKSDDKQTVFDKTGFYSYKDFLNSKEENP